VSAADFLVVGAGVIGVCIARELKRRLPDCRVIVLEKERAAGLHASGRNSGVLHAGFYYSPDGLKARFTRLGNQAMREFCIEHQLPLRDCGKLVTATCEQELKGLDELMHRGGLNGVELRLVDEQEAREIEPRAKVLGRAIFSPTTACVDPGEVMRALVACAQAEGIEFRHGEAFAGWQQGRVRTSEGSYSARYVINAAGLYADKVAHAFGHGTRYRILPFRGRYLRSAEPAGSFRTPIYPVPDSEWPFLGVHTTITIDGGMKIGPTAFPAFWREHYRGVENFSLPEMLEIVAREARLLLGSRFRFRELAWSEVQALGDAAMIARASKLATGLTTESFSTRTNPGIRAQLLELESGRLEMDFVMESDHLSLHVLNAVSPAFTCAFPIASHVCDEVESQLRSD